MRFDWKKDIVLHQYILRLGFRVLVFLLILWAYIFQPHYFDFIITKTVQLKYQIQGFTISEVREIWQSQYSVIWIYAIWAIFMFSMFVQMFIHTSNLTMGARKVFEPNYKEVQDYNETKLYKYILKENIGALKVLLAWLGINSIVGALYVFDIIQIKELCLLCGFYYLSDLICVVVWCPFQRFLMKNRCCVNCRIFNWGFFMIFTPFLFIRNFFTWSLFFMSCVLLIRWEWTYTKHPERFWEGSNEVLKCENCQDKVCKIKGKKVFDDEGKLIMTIRGGKNLE